MINFRKENDKHYIITDNDMEVGDIYHDDNDWWFSDRDVWEYTKEDLFRIVEFMRGLL